MSAAVALPAAGVAAMAAINPMDVLMQSINTSPYFIGLMMLLLNLGGRFLALEISKEQEKFLSQPWIRRFFLFAILFVFVGIQLLAMGLIGEYIGRIYAEVRNRPRYVIRRISS